MRSELAVPLIAKNKVIGVIDVEAAQPDAFTEEHKRLLTLFASRIAVGIENARLYTRVARQARQLTLLTEISRELTSILNVDQLLKRIADLLTRIIDYQMFSILLLDPSGSVLQHRFSLRFKESVQLKHEIPLGVGLVGYAAQHGQAVLVPDVSKDPRYIEANPETRSELCIPLIYKDKVIGVLDIEHTRRNYFNEDHVRIMTTMAAQVAIAIENATLYERIARQEKRLEQDLALARELQFRLLPQKLPVFKNAEVASRFAPARQIGGDLYDFLKYSGHGVTGIAVGDVSGKGAPAAIYAALVSGIARSHANEEPSAAGMLEAINLSLSERPIEGQYVSMIYAIWDDNQQTLQIGNSGLPRPIHLPRRQARGDSGDRSAHRPVQQRDLRRADPAGRAAAMSSSSSATAFSMRPVPRARCSAAQRLEKIADAKCAAQRRRTGGRHLHRGVQPCRRRRGLRRSDDRRPQSERTCSQKVKARRLPERPPGFIYQSARRLLAPVASCTPKASPSAALAEALRHAALRLFGDDDSPALSSSSTGPSRLRTHRLLLGEGELESVDPAAAGQVWERDSTLFPAASCSA